MRVALLCFGRTGGPEVPHLDGVPVTEIRADLKAGGADLTRARRLPENRGLCLQGPVKVGAFDIDGELARRWLAEPMNPNGRPNTDVVRPWINGQDITRRPSGRWIVDFADMSERQAAFYSRPFAHIALHVKPERDRNRDTQRRTRWWQLGRSGSDLRSALATLSRFIATPRVARHRVFVWCHPATLPDSRVYAIARGTAARLGVRLRRRLAGARHWRRRSAARSRCRACRCRRRSGPGAADRHRAATSASAATCSCGG